MNIIVVLKIVFSLILVWISYQVIVTSLESNLFKEWDFLGSIPWMRATLWDFYANLFVIYLWVLYKERNIAVKILWLVLLFCLGSIGTCIYTLIQLFKLKAGEGVSELINKKN
ncbi:MAG TPA: DUF1475 family protein [Pedobacter sp.]|nr:DUF1475 family protein [Pedobacter sp.]